MNLLSSPISVNLTVGLLSTAIAVCLWFLLTAIASVVRGIEQSKQVQSRLRAQSDVADRELATTLYQTYTDQSIRERAAEWHQVQVVRVDDESVDVKSFFLVDTQHDALPPYLPGQHLLLERPPTASEPAACRCYSLSDDCRAGYWRISVKKQSDFPGSVSRWLHEEITVGDILRVRGPSGAFYLQPSTHRHVVLASAGIGITPMLPMLKEVLQRPHLSLSVLAQFRDVDHMPFAEPLLNVAHQFPNVHVRLFLGRFPRGIQSADDRNTIVEGKFNAADLCEGVPDLHRADFYLCGPESWQSELRNGLLDQGVRAESIRFELFQESESPVPASRKNASESCSVHFRQSNKLATFAATYPNLLGFAMKSDIPINSGCRTGACGSCAVRLLEGKVRYTKKPQYPLKSNEILPCVCVPDGDIVVEA